MLTRRRTLTLVLAGLVTLTMLTTLLGCQQAAPTATPSNDPMEAPVEVPSDGPGTELSGRLQIAGSTTVQPLVQALAEVFVESYPDVDIDVQSGGSSLGVKSAAEGTTPIGMASRELKQSEIDEYPDLVEHTIARDGIAIAAHTGVPVDGLSLDEVRQIFAGQIVNWSEVGGPDESIIVVSREEGSGTRGAFEEMVMGDSLIADTVLLQPSNGAVKTTVATTPNAIGYLSFGYLDDSVKTVAVDGVEPTVANAQSDAYPVVRPLNLLTLGEPTGLEAAFLDFIFSEAGQVVVAQDYIPVN